MILSRKCLLATLLMLSSACLVSADNVFNGFIQVTAGLVRQTSNANVAMNAQFVRTATVQTSGNSVIFFNEIVNINQVNVTALNITIPNVTITRAVANVATYPLPKVFVTKTTATIGAGFGFTTQASAAAFPAAVEYTEVNNVAGFQAGVDKVVQNISLTENLQSWFLDAAPNNWNPITVTTEMFPSPTNATMMVPVMVAKSCNKVNGFCFTFRYAHALYVRNGITYLPDAVKVDVLANTAKFTTATGMLAILSHMLSTAESFTLTDNHIAVDNTMAQAKAVQGTAVVTADFMFSFNAANNNSAYLNFARTAIQTSAAGVNTTINVMAQAVQNATASALIMTMANVNYNGQAAQIDTNFQAMTTVQAIVYSFLAANNGAASITWDPEFGVANVNTSNTVVGGTPARLSGGAIAGIVIGVFAAVGIAGFFGYRAYKKRQLSKGGVLLR